MTILITVISLFLAGAAASPALPKMNSGADLRICGPAFLVPIAEGLAEELKEESESLDIKIAPAGEEEGLKALLEGQCDAVMITRPLSEAEFKSAVDKGILPVYHPIGFSSLAVIVYPENDVRNIRINSLRKVYQNRIRNWKYLGWQDWPIRPITPPGNTAAGQLFTRLVMEDDDWLRKYHRYVDRDELTVLHKVQVNWGGIGYVGPLYAGPHVRVPAVEGIEYTPENVRSGKYPLAAPVFFVTRGYPKTGSYLRVFVTLPLSRAGQKIIAEGNLVPFTDYP